MKVIEVAGSPVAAFAGMLLVALGHEITRVERPGSRGFAEAGAEPVDAAGEAYLHRGKQHAELDLRTRSGADGFVALTRAADAVVEDLGPGRLERLGLAPRRLRRGHRDLMVVRVSPFGQAGPRSHWQASELVLQAMGGVVHSTGFEDSAPLALPEPAVHFIGGIHAATAVLAGSLGVAVENELGAVVDISLEEVYLHHWVRHIGQWAHGGLRTRREDRDSGRQGFPHTVMTADGWLYVLALYAEWEPLAAFFALDQFTTHEWSDHRVRAERWPEIAPHYRAAVASRKRYDWFAAAAARGYTFAPIHSLLDLPGSPQYQARGCLDQVEVDGRVVPCPGLPFAWQRGEQGPSRA